MLPRVATRLFTAVVVGAFLTVLARAGVAATSVPPRGARGPATAGVSSVPASPFVSAVGTQLYLNGLPWRFTGYDLYQLTSIAVGANWNCGGDFNQAWLDQTLDEIKADSDSPVIRTWFFQSYSADDYIQFDTVLAAAAARGIKIIPVLVNQWGDCEPNVNGTTEYKTLSWYQGGYKMAGDNYPLPFRQYAIDMAQRYANNPTIAFWQLVNEAEAGPGGGQPCDETAAAHALRAFADDMTAAMKAVDPNHLVSLGTIGGGQCGTSWTDYEYVHAGLVDICEYHDYTDSLLPGDPWNGAVDDLRECAALGKPTFAGEVGIDASVQPDWSTTGVVTPQTLAQRATFFQEKMSAQFAAGTQGFLIWTRNPGSVSAGLEVGTGDPTTSVLLAFQRQLDAQDDRVAIAGDPSSAVTSNATTAAGATVTASARPAQPATIAAHPTWAAPPVRAVTVPRPAWLLPRLR